VKSGANCSLNYKFTPLSVACPLSCGTCCSNFALNNIQPCLNAGKCINSTLTGFVCLCPSNCFGSSCETCLATSKFKHFFHFQNIFASFSSQSFKLNKLLNEYEYDLFQNQ
jgi:hypothetical protein